VTFDSTPVVIRKILQRDNIAVARLIRTVMPEFGAGGKGFAIHDAEVDDMFAAYSAPLTVYFVCEENGRIIGGAGIGPLRGGPEDVCELKKMYFLTEGRGRGLGRKVLTKCLDAARRLGFRTCYIETFNTMKDAMRLYERNGFQKISGSLGNTGHFACDTFYALKLNPAN
jgi:putative acetyltransferase